MADIEVGIENGIAVVTLNRPSVRNAMTLAMWKEIATIFGRLGDNLNVRAIILTGAGGNFSVGADISEFGKVRADLKQSADYEVAVDASSDAIQNTPKPVIAVIEGYCLGGGCHLAMPCDFRFAHTESSLGIPAAKLSIVYGIRSTQRLFSLVGVTNAKRILYTADRFGADEAAAMGFVQQVSSDPMRDAMAFAGRIAALAPLSVAGAKQILNGLAMGPGVLNEQAAQAFIDCVSDSDDYKEGRKAFAEKRAPAFKGK